LIPTTNDPVVPGVCSVFPSIKSQSELAAIAMPSVDRQLTRDERGADIDAVIEALREIRAIESNAAYHLLCPRHTRTTSSRAAGCAARVSRSLQRTTAL
jgi:hypothetical protein